jgi:hypothetical protein
MPNQLLAYLRMSRIQDPIELTKVNFEADQLVSQMNEYETLMLMMSDLRDRIELYKGNIEEEIKILQDQTLTEQERVASKLRMSEKRVLQECMNGVRRRLAPIRGASPDTHPPSTKLGFSRRFGDPPNSLCAPVQNHVHRPKMGAQ